jgi:hypothetical protein
MRPIFIVIIAALAITLAARYSAKVVTAEAPQQSQSTAGPMLINVMEMMRQAKDLPIQQFDAI